MAIGGRQAVRAGGRTVRPPFARRCGAGAAALLVTLASCSGGGTEAARAKRIAGFIGGVASDEPRATLAGRDVLARGGTAADAAVAVGFMLAATLPSRASLGAGGACHAYAPTARGPGHPQPTAILFTPVPGAPAGVQNDRPAAVPMLARGLFLLDVRYGGGLPFEALIAPAETVAQSGAPVSRALAADLAVVAAPLLGDPAARAVFGPALHEGDTLVQTDLGATLDAIRSGGVGSLYQGPLAQRFAAASALAGGSVPAARLHDALPEERSAIVLPDGRDQVAFLPPPADGGLAAAAAFHVLASAPQDVAGAGAAAASVVVYERATGGDPQALLAMNTPPATLPALPASTSFTVLDRRGGAVACALTMDNLFGTGRVAPGTGVVLAAAPRPASAPLLAAAIAWDADRRAFRAAAAASGQGFAGLAAGVGIHNALAGSASMPDQGRVNVMSCGGGLPGAPSSCAWATDPKGYGLAAGSIE